MYPRIFDGRTFREGAGNEMNKYVMEVSAALDRIARGEDTSADHELVMGSVPAGTYWDASAIAHRDIEWQRLLVRGVVFNRSNGVYMVAFHRPQQTDAGANKLVPALDCVMDLVGARGFLQTVSLQVYQTQTYHGPRFIPVLAGGSDQVEAEMFSDLLEKLRLSTIAA